MHRFMIHPGGAMKLFSKIFRPKEVRDVLFSLDQLDASSLAQTMYYEEIKTRAGKAISANPELVRKMLIVEEQKPLQVALNLIVNICGGDLRSGSDHIYRGVLGMRGTPKRALFFQAQAIMVERGYITQEDAECGRKLLADDIRQAG
jgi:hypothetical protein